MFFEKVTAIAKSHGTLLPGATEGFQEIIDIEC